MKLNSFNRRYLLIPLAAIAMIAMTGPSVMARESSEGSRGNDSTSGSRNSSVDGLRQNRHSGDDDFSRFSGSSSNSSRSFDGAHQNRHSGDDDFYRSYGSNGSSFYDGSHQNRHSGDDDFYRYGNSSDSSFDDRFGFDDRRGRGRGSDDLRYYRPFPYFGFSRGGHENTFSHYGGFGSAWRSFWR